MEAVHKLYKHLCSNWALVNWTQSRITETVNPVSMVLTWIRAGQILSPVTEQSQFCCGWDKKFYSVLWVGMFKNQISLIIRLCLNLKCVILLWSLVIIKPFVIYQSQKVKINMWLFQDTQSKMKRNVLSTLLYIYVFKGANAWLVITLIVWFDFIVISIHTWNLLTVWKLLLLFIITVIYLQFLL